MKRKFKKLTPFLILLILTVWVFRAWFVFKSISAGDWEFLYSETIHSFTFTPFSWLSSRGLGANSLSTLWIGSYYHSTAFVSNQIFKIPWLVAEKLIWFWPFLILTIFSSWYLANKTLFPKNKIIHFFAPFIYLFNTYILMVVGGGQMGVAMAYAVAPLVLGLFINLINKLKSSRVNELKKLVLAGAVLAVQVVFDPRISLITMGAVFLYAVFQYGVAIKKYIRVFVLPFFIALGLHFYWLLPVILVRRAALPVGYGEAGWVEFLSFGNFSDSLSLLHPNWPENIFGKTYFMRPEFLIIPIIAFSALLFRRRDKKVLFFSILALLGAFLAKGSKPPFGGIYLWLFKYFPGMNMFRDPTKFYLFVALSYSILIPFSLEQIVKKFNKKFGAWRLVLGAFLICWLFLIRPAWLGQLSGTFKAKEVPAEYVVLKDFIHNQDEFFRTFWIPKRQRFGFFSHNHPAIESSELLSEEELAVMGVKYVIVPYDSEGEIFLEDRKYDPEQRLALERELDEIPWLKKIEVADKIAVYEAADYKDHFFVADEEIPSIDWTMVNPTKYKVRISEATQPFNLVFSEAYDELWQAKVGERIIPSKVYNSINSFAIEQAGDFEMIIEFAAQKYVCWGLMVSAATLLTAFIGLVYLWRK